MKIGQIAFLIIVILSSLSCNFDVETGRNDEKYNIYSDLEELIEIDGRKKFKSTIDNIYFDNGGFVSTEHSLSGKQCIKLNEDQVYGLNLKLSDIRPGQFIRASIWQKKGGKDGTLVASVKGDGYENKFRTYYEKNKEGKNGWVQHYLTFIVTQDVVEVSFFIFSGKKEAYFDDILIEVFPNAPINNLEKKLSLFLPDHSENKLTGFINNSLRSEIITSDNKKYVKAFLLDGQDSVKVKMKLKGDWTDHLRSGKTSYRIKIGDNYAFDGLKSFSIQHPRTRNFVHEWVLHQMADMEGVLTTDYDFINVSINNFDYGVYAIEEHFDKQLIESRNRREGPILKLDESGAWAFNYKKAVYGVKSLLPFFKASIASVFKKKRTLSNPVLYSNFIEGSALLWHFKNASADLETIFDIDVLARFYALVELSSHNHALAWHNRRFYFNPITQKLEPILYDVIPHARTNEFYNNIEKKLTGMRGSEEDVFDNQILLNKDFKEKYLYYLNTWTEKTYLDSIFTILNSDLEKNVGAIQIEDKSYEFDKSEYYRNAEYLKGRIPKLDSVWNALLKTPKNKEDWLLSKVYTPCVDSFFVKEISVNAFVEELDSNHFSIDLENFHTHPVTVIGYKPKKPKDSIVTFDLPIDLSGFEVNSVSKKIITDLMPKSIIFKVNNLPEQIIKKGVIPWPKPKNVTTRMKLSDTFSRRNGDYRIVNNKVEIRGNTVIDKLIYIPKEYEVHILPGTRIEFKNGGGLIVNNSVYVKGTENNLIEIVCNDSLSQGITVLNGREAVFENVSLSGLSNLNYENWILTGALTIYETKSYLKNVVIQNNYSEDALNIVRSEFEIDGLTIRSTYSDGFDADFCQGLIKNSYFENTGNDCIDFSGSKVEIENVSIKESGDKGISGGEKSELTITDILIENAVTGIASKDESLIKGSKVKVSNVKYGFSAFQKKGEYAPAKIDITESSWTDIEQLKLIDLGSEINLNGTKVTGETKIDIDLLYSEFDKNK